MHLTVRSLAIFAVAASALPAPWDQNGDGPGGPDHHDGGPQNWEQTSTWETTPAPTPSSTWESTPAPTPSSTWESTPNSGPSSVPTEAPSSTWNANAPPATMWNWNGAPPASEATAFPTGTGGVNGLPFSFPLSNGFPNVAPGSAALASIQQAAHGTLPNGGLPSEISATSALVFSVIAFGEIFEVAYFTELIYNITNNVPGYEIGSGAARAVVLDALIAVQAQEELHALGVNGILTTSGNPAIQPCQYDFPVDSFDDAISFAATFTDVVLGTLQEAIFNFGADGDGADFLKLVSSVIGQEGEQNGFYRSLSPAGKIPSQLPFLTQSSGVFAYSVINQLVIVPGSCPNANVITVPILGALNVETQNLSPATSSIDFSIAASGAPTSGFNVVYINQQNTPVVVPATNIQTSGDAVTFSATFPYTQYEMNGLTIAAITNSTGPFANATQVAMSAMYGPGIIDFN